MDGWGGVLRPGDLVSLGAAALAVELHPWWQLAGSRSSPAATAWWRGGRHGLHPGR